VPALDAAKIALTRTFTLADELRAHQAKVAADPNLSPMGRLDSIHKVFAEKTAPELHRARKTVETMRVNVAKRRERLVPPAADKTDPAAISMRAEARAVVRAMNPGQRAKMLMARDADPMLLAAVLEAPSWMTGVQDDVRTYITNAVIEKAHPGALAVIDSANDAIDSLEGAIQYATQDICAIAEFPSWNVLDIFIQRSLKDTAHIDASVERDFSSLAEAA
jgi:hypothetical protein